jgi:hypothetical protein
LDLDERLDDWECDRSKRIEGIQRNDNPFLILRVKVNLIFLRLAFFVAEI